MSRDKDETTMEETSPSTLNSTASSKGEEKRDSGIVPQDAHTSAIPTAAAKTWTPPPVLVESPSLPSIIVHDAPPSTSRSLRAPLFLRKKSKDNTDTDTGTESSPRAASAHARMRSFHGIEMNIPTGTSDFEDLNSPDSLKFSTRGSILLSPKMKTKTAGALDDNDDDMSPVESEFQTAPNSPAEFPATTAPPSPPLSPDLAPTTPAKKRLTAGPRTPNPLMLQAAIDGRRVLSVEEVTFSQKVRSMYEYGDERAAEWSSPGFDREDTPEPKGDSPLTIPRRRPATSQSNRQGNKRFSFLLNEHERAGGIEDWEDLTGNDIDRYGFINPHKVINTDAVGNQTIGHRPSIQRVTTSLQLLSSSPRQRRGMMRGPSTVRSARSLPPSGSVTRSSTFRSSPGPDPSIYSFHSNHSTNRVQNPFRSRDRRILDEASDMLTLPACLNNLPENDAHEEFLRRREWGREEKWRKMARLVDTNKGGGMNFDFDIKDPKLIARTWKGVPDKWRATAWHSFLSQSAKRRGGYESDAELIEIFHELQDQSSADDVQIDVDVPRTISMHIMFRRRYRGGQRLLFRVLHAISVHFPSTGYVQGMAALAATLLCYYDEENTFVMLVRMWELRGLKSLYESGFEGLMSALKDFEDDWLGKDPELKAKLDDFGITGTTYGTKWYLTLFNLSIPFPAQLRVWDVFMLLGDMDFPGSPQSKTSVDLFGGADLSVLHATSAALVDATKAVIHESDFENSMKVLTSWIPVKDEDMLMRVAKAEWKIHMKNRRHGFS